MSLRIWFVAGGTGGHVLPAIAVAEEVRRQRPSAQLRFVGGKRGIEGELVSRHGFKITRLPAAGMRGLGFLGAVRFAVAFVEAFARALGMVFVQRPDVVLATGGYASAAPALAAAITFRPVWLQEQNSVPGSTNRLLGHLCERVYIAFESARAAFAGSVHLAPNPVRRSVRESVGCAASAEDHTAFGLKASRPTVLIFGGSRGAATLNRAFRDAWPALRDTNDWQYLVQTGEQEWESTRAVVDQDDDDASRARVLPFIDDMAAAWRVADIVVCRAGAMTLAELAVVGRPAILVPFPHATDDHQTRNAQELVAVGAARCVADAEFDGPRLLLELQALQESRPDRESIARAARAWGGERDGAVEIAEALIARAEGGRAA